jgi:ribosome-binding protein aMBF1 (putative translation factor)
MTICNITIIPKFEFCNSFLFYDIVKVKKGATHMKKIENSECLVGFGSFIKEGREKRGMSQAEVAESIGIKQPYYSRIERGGRNVDFVLALKICQVLGIDANEFIKRYM